MQVLTAAEMRECDQRTVDQSHATLLSLMENAGAAVAAFALLKFPHVAGITVLCGRGNNGGDGLVAARHLDASGKPVQILLLSAPEKFHGQPRAVYEKLPQVLRDSALVVVGADDLSKPAFARCFAGTELFIDSIFGTGFHPPLTGTAAMLRDAIDRHSAPVLSVDLPSGWDADSTAMHADGPFRSDAVVTFSAPKFAHVFGALTRGPVAVAQIGSPDSAILSTAGLSWTGASKKIIAAPRALDGNKGRFGHVLVVGGSPGKAGAPSMSSLAAMRAGAGLVTAAVPRSIAVIVAGFAPEMMTLILEESSGGDISKTNLQAEHLETILRGISVLAVGPGIGRASETAEFVRDLIAKTKLPAVLDADGLNAFENQAQQLDGKNRTLVLTPHPGEMARLLGCTIADVERDRIGIARSFATEHQVTLVLKGWRTLVAHPDGRIAVNTSGNPALAKGGSGDILTGLVAALIAQFPQRISEAVECAVWLHGAAADIYTCTHDEHTMLATDILDNLSAAIRKPVEHDGFIWLQEGQS
jgi:hydroxyethylthiazole kinase-like uncharacterized protein yjeF